MYVAVKGGEKAIDNAHRLLASERRGREDVPEISTAQIAEQLKLGVARVMAEGSLYDPEIASLAIKQARGDLIEAIFLTRAYRTTLPRFGYSEPVETNDMAVERRISATYKDLPGGQILGATFDYTHRLIDFSLAQPSEPEAPQENPIVLEPAPHVTGLLDGEGLIERNAALTDVPPRDLTREPISYPAGRDLRLQNLARGDEGFLLSLAYSSQRGFGSSHPFVGEIRIGEVEVEFFAEELGFAVTLGRVQLTECEMVNQFKGSSKEPPQFTRGYGLVFGQSERKGMSMALVDRALRAEELGQDVVAPVQDQEFVLSHSDNVQATGFVEHLKLPHYVDFQAELGLVRKMRVEHAAANDRPDVKEAAE
jgi:alpha-D-ribose 1-methylphosphonate 5-triphosphate synthase subunit PhnI